MVRKLSSMLLFACVIVGCASTSAPSPTPSPVEASAGSPATVPEIQPGILQGYLGKTLPNSLALLPIPPAAGGAAFSHDENVHRTMQLLRGSPRYALASRDAVLGFPQAAGSFACALDIPIDAQGTPRLYLLLRRTLTDAGLATYAAKNHYQRVRPFAYYDEDTCTPKEEASLRTDGSYPSGHAAIGWAWALVLTELAPERRDTLLARGRAFGESRLVCNVHWQSDVLEGRMIAAGVVAQLHSSPTFVADMAAAKQEIEGARSRGARPTGDCAAEANVLSARLPGVL